MRFAPGCFWNPYNRPTFFSIFPWSSDICVCELCKCASALCMSSSDASFVIYYLLLGIPKNMNVLVITLLYGHLWRRSLQQKCSSMIALQVHIKKEMMPFAPGCFWSPYSRATFLSIFPWSPLVKISENGRFRSPWQICHNSALRALMEAQFAAKCSSMIAL